MSRACSAYETDPCYRSGDTIAPRLLPGGMQPLLHFRLARKLFTRMAAPKGIYEYVIARTKYIDAAFHQALADGFDQALIFGAGFDTRALRFRDALENTRVFELDAPTTQQAKIGQYHRRGLALPPGLTFIPIDFDKESLPDKLEAAGFRRGRRSLFILEGLLMYLQPESVNATFQVIQEYAGAGSRVVFDYIHAAVLRGDGRYYGEEGIVKTVTGAGERWHFGIEDGQAEAFLDRYGLRLLDHKDAADLERAYFSRPGGEVIARINATHCLVTAERS